MQRIKSVDSLRFPLAVFVVMEHTLLHYSTDGTEPITYLIFDTFIRDNSVPVFFFISGFLFFSNTEVWNISVWRNKIKRRIHSLFIPYLIWNTYAILFLWIAMKCGMVAYMAAGAKFTPSVTNILSCFWAYDNALAGTYLPTIFPINVALWYVRDLFIICLITPLIYPILKKYPIPTLIILLLAWIFTDLYWSTPLFFFSLGACYSIHKRSLPALRFKTTTILSSLYFLSGLIVCLYPKILETDYFQYFKIINIITFLFLAIQIAARLSYNKITSFLSEASIFLFMSHQPICGKINKVLILVLKPQNGEFLTATNLLSIIITVSGTLAIYYLLSRYMPQTLHIMTGRTSEKEQKEKRQ